MNSFVLTCVPLFMLMAEILRVSGLSSRIYGGLAKLIARLPGGLLQTNIAGCAVFASVSGSSIATAASIGGVALPQLIRRRYHRPLAAGSLAAGGTIGILLPPSFGMIVYGTFTETSVPKLFMAGVIPGLIMTAMFMSYIGVHAAIRPAVAPREAGPGSMKELVAAVVDVLPFAILIAGTLGAIYRGLVTTTEGATIGCILAIILGGRSAALRRPASSRRCAIPSSFRGTSCSSSSPPMCSPTPSVSPGSARRSRRLSSASISPGSNSSSHCSSLPSGAFSRPDDKLSVIHQRWAGYASASPPHGL
jgi:tripartite ATP-independent transporter DctM subunit